MPHGMFEAYYPSLGGKSCNKFNVSDGNLQTRTNVVNVRRHKYVTPITFPPWMLVIGVSTSICHLVVRFVSAHKIKIPNNFISQDDGSASI